MQCTGNSGWFPPGKASSHSTALPRVFFLRAVFSCFHNSPNTDMDYMILNVRTYVLTLMRAYTHRGLDTPTMKVSTTF